MVNSQEIVNTYIIQVKCVKEFNNNIVLFYHIRTIHISLYLLTDIYFGMNTIVLFQFYINEHTFIKYKSLKKKP